MKCLRGVAVLSACSLGFVVFSRAQGPNNSGSETVARPKKGSAPAPEEQQPKIPSKFSKKDTLPEGVPTFSTDAITVTVDVSVLDSKGHFIPKIPRDKFRVLEDNVPQQISSYSVSGEAPMTIAMVIEFS